MGPAAKRSKRLARLIRLVAVFAAVLVLAGVFGGEFAHVSGRSMEPTLADGDRVFFEKLSVRWSDLKRFDMVVFKAPDDPDRIYIKRIVGLPGDVVEAAEGVWRVNGNAVPLPAGVQFGGLKLDPVVVSPAHYYVLGDNLGDSVDSRQWGAVPRDYVLGRVVLRFWPATSMRIYRRADAQEQGV
jgi:signal peptidase I